MSKSPSKIGQSPASPVAEQSSSGSAFPDSSILSPQVGIAITSPLKLDHNPTPRPHLFTSLEEAREHVYRKSSDSKPASRNASGVQSEDESSLGEMNLPPSTRFGRSLTSRAESRSHSPALPAYPSSPVPGFHPITRPVVWEDVPQPLNTSSSRNASYSAPSQTSGSSVANIIGQYGQRSSSAVRSRAAVYGGSSSNAEVDLAGQDYDGTFEGEEKMEKAGYWSRAIDKSAPSRPPTSDAPLHPSNPFFQSRRPATTDPGVPKSSRNLGSAGLLPLLRETTTSEDEPAKVGSDPELESLESPSTSSEAPSVAESKVGPLLQSMHMHSARRQQRPHADAMNHTEDSTARISEATDATEFDDDPFRYDRRGPRLYPSREQVVSANLRKVSGIPRESTATVYSQDGTPSRTFYGEAAADYFSADGSPIMPDPGRHPHLGHDSPLRRNPVEHMSTNVTRSFYDAKAIEPDWASDVSDKDLPPQSFTGLDGGPFADDGLVHPPRQGTFGLPGRSIFRPREIRGTPAPVFLPEPRIHRVNGLFTNDSRIPPQHQQQRPPSASLFPPVRDLLQSSSQKRPPIAKFSPHKGQPNKFDFTRLKSAKAGGSYEMHPLTPSGKPQQQTVTRGLRKQPYGLVTPAALPAVFHNRHLPEKTVESDESFNQSLADSPFLRLIPLDEARKRSDTRRASGQHESATPKLKAHGAAAQHAIRHFSSTISTAGTSVTVPPALHTPPVSRFAPRAIPKAAKMVTMKNQIGTQPTISTINDGSGQIIHTVTYPDGSRSFIFDPEPRLVPWDQRHHYRRGLAAPWSTDRSLQDIQRGRPATRGMARVQYSDHERWYSPDADHRRRVFFLYTAIFSVFPFISVIVLCGGFNAAMSWATYGEVNRFSRRQMNVIMVEAVFGTIAFISLIVFGVLKIR